MAANRGGREAPKAFPPSEQARKRNDGMKPGARPVGPSFHAAPEKESDMTQAHDHRPAAYLIVLLGLGEAAAASLVPYYHVGYLLEPGILLAVLMPFLLYGLFIESLRGAWLLGSGLVLLAANLLFVAWERFLHYNDYADDRIYWVPTASAVIVLAIAYWQGRGADQPDDATTHAPAH